jgi:hypothetical protein
MTDRQVAALSFFGVIIVIEWVVGLMLVLEPSPELKSQPEPITRQEAASSLPVKLDVSLVWTDSRHAAVVGQTNLPDGTQVMVSVAKDKSSGLSLIDRLVGQENVTVSNGQFRSGPYGAKSGLCKGNYTAEALMVAPSAQYPSVRRIIGDRGERLSGNLVRQDGDGYTASAAYDFSTTVTCESEICAEFLDWMKATVPNNNKELALQKAAEAALTSRDVDTLDSISREYFYLSQAQQKLSPANTQIGHINDLYIEYLRLMSLSLANDVLGLTSNDQSALNESVDEMKKALKYAEEYQVALEALDSQCRPK